ncbi:S-layer homology domain-containing protein [Acutalibacter caecimuris]|uniref:S-layer homology domain-containing protein n=1 Tax=Acutalibacter caecimuris TaxID=3093657 RepID=UPI002AC90D67|nr:S-layer homology domain-containing protein [Acutalibacter sp. M00118]
MKKCTARWLSLVFALCLLMTGFVPVCAGAVYDDHVFEDLGTKNCYESYINQGAKLGFVSGTSETTFSPKQQVTRGEAVTMLGRMHEKYTSNPVEDSAETSFQDVHGKAYYTKYVAWAEKNSLVTGYGDGTFRPGRAITNCELAVILQNYLGLVESHGLYPVGDNPFHGEFTPPTWAADAMQEMCDYGVYSYNGTPEDEFLNPWLKSTREMTVTAIVRLYERILFRPETIEPCLAYRYEAPAITADVSDFYPLGENRFQVVSSLEEFFSLREQVKEESQQFTLLTSGYCNLELSEVFFTEYDLLAVDVQAKFHPDLVARWMDLEITEGTADVNFACDGLVGKSLDVPGYIFFLVVPKGADITTVNQHWYHLTEKSWTTSAEENLEEWGKELPPLLTAE